MIIKVLHMVVFKNNKLNDLFTIMNTIRQKHFLDKNRIYYNLSVLGGYKRLDYKNLIIGLNKRLEKYKDIFSDKEYIVYLSKFGAFGSYKLPNKVYINIQRDRDEIVKTILHEVVHLQVEKEVMKKGLDHQQKEKLVDDILENYQEDL